MDAVFKSRLMDADGMRRALMRISHEILERNHGADELTLVGIRRRGVPLAHLLRENILRIEGREVPVGELDITFYRDDLQQKEESPLVGAEPLGLEVTGRRVILVDDVIFTGRTARAAIEAVLAKRLFSAAVSAVVSAAP